MDPPVSFLHSRKLQLAVICAVCTGLVVGALVCGRLGFGFGSLVGWELQFRNVLYEQGRKNPADPRLIYLGIDNESVSIEKVDLETLFADVPRDGTDFRALELISRGYPWPREVHALVLDKLFAAGASVVIMDLLFLKPSADDAAFRAALDRYRERVVLGSNFGSNTDTHGDVNWELTLPAEELIPQTSPIDPRVGFVNFFAGDLDETVRRAPFRMALASARKAGVTAGDEIYLSLSAVAVSRAGLAHLIPPLPASERLFRFTAPPGIGFPPRSLYQLFVPKYWAANFAGGEGLRGKIVLVGPFGNWAHDEHTTPFGKMPGPELHLNAINALLHQAYLTETPLWADCVLVFLAGLSAWLVSQFTPRPALLVLRAVAANGLLLLLAFEAFNHLNTCTAVIAPLLALNLSGGACFMYEYVHEQLERRRTRRTLERYVSKDVVRELLDNRASLLHALGGARKPITVLFSDLRGFTTLTESADAVALVDQLNEYFNKMVRLVFANSGTLDKFIGDGLMAHWGSIVTGGAETDACQAVRTAVSMRGALAELNADWKSRGIATLDFGIGINSGEAIVGNLGCDEKMEVSLVGDPVNLAARIEGATKEYHVDLLIGAETARLVRDRFLLRSVDFVRVKGKTKPVEVFTVIAERMNGAPAPEWLDDYEQGVSLCRERKYSEAGRLLGQVVALHPEDWLAAEYLRRAEQYAAVPPPADWDGVYVMTTK